MANNSRRRRRSSSASPMTSILIVAAALLVFVIVVGAGCSLLGGSNEPVNADPSSSSVEEPSSSLPGTSIPVPLAPSGSVPASSSDAASVGAPASSTPAPSGTSGSSASVPVSGSNEVSGVFDASIYSDSGASNIPNYQQINSDVKGWIKVPGTNIDYPVLHDTRIYEDVSNPHFYFRRNIYKADDKYGAVIYADPAVRFGSTEEISQNTVIYGHNWTNVSATPRIGNVSSDDVFFAQLVSYHSLNFAKSHPYIFYSTEAEEMTWQVFATFYTDVSFDYNWANPTAEKFSEILAGAKKRSRHNFDVAVGPNDKILTLSTCSHAYGSDGSQRFVVMARLMDNGEELTPVNVTANPNPQLPKM